MDRNLNFRLTISILLLVLHAITVVSSTDPSSPSPTDSLKNQAPPPNQVPGTSDGRKSDPGSRKNQPLPSVDSSSVNSVPPPPPIKVDNNNIPLPPESTNMEKAPPGKPDKEKDKKIDPLRPDTKSELGPKDMHNKSPPPQGRENKGNSNMSPPPTKLDGKDASKGNHEHGGNKDTYQQTCDVGAHCQLGALVACLQYPNNGLNRSYILVNNTGETTLNIEIKVPSSIIIDIKNLNLSKHDLKKINFSTKSAESYKIELTSRNQNCTLQTRSLPSPWFQQFGAYPNRLTPIYGSVILLFTVVLVGGIWACCKFRRKARRTDNRVPYQQLEMGTQPGSSSADVNEDTADNWDDGWGNDWDEDEELARPSEKNPAVTAISSNGLTSRSGIKDGWDVDWDD